MEVVHVVTKVELKIVVVLPTVRALMLILLVFEREPLE